MHRSGPALSPYTPQVPELSVHTPQESAMDKTETNGEERGGTWWHGTVPERNRSGRKEGKESTGARRWREDWIVTFLAE